MRLYRWLLHAYPASFRGEYVEELCAVFARERRQVSGWGLPLFWLRTALDVLLNAIRVHADILRQDIRYTFRTLGRPPGFAFTAVLVAARNCRQHCGVYHGRSCSHPAAAVPG